MERVASLRVKHNEAVAASAVVGWECWDVLRRAHGNCKAPEMAAIDPKLTDLRMASDEAFEELASALVDLHVMQRAVQRETAVVQLRRDIQV